MYLVDTIYIYIDRYISVCVRSYYKNVDVCEVLTVLTNHKVWVNYNDITTTSREIIGELRG
jgi:hypothetical protein